MKKLAYVVIGAAVVAGIAVILAVIFDHDHTPTPMPTTTTLPTTTTTPHASCKGDRDRDCAKEPNG